MNKRKPKIHKNIYKLELKVAISAAKKAGKLVKGNYYLKNEFREKAEKDFVTKVDIESEKTICSHISRHFPNDGVLSEEGVKNHTKNGRTWVIDPLDGTSAYMLRAGKNLPSIMIALEKRKDTKLAVIYFPLTRELFWAVKGLGAYKNKQKIKAVKKNSLKSSWVDFNLYQSKKWENGKVRTLQLRLRGEGGAKAVTTNLPSSGLAVRVVEGDMEIDALIHDNNPKWIKQEVWDVAAPKLFVTEAGGEYIALSGNNYDPASPEPILVAKSKKLAQEIQNQYKNALQ